MNKERVIVYPVEITKRGEIISFQIKLPSDAKSLIGLEYSVRGIEYIGQFIWDPPMYDFLRARYVMKAGRLSLFSAERSNCIFNQYISLNDNNIAQGDFSQSLRFHDLSWTHGNKREEIPLVFTDKTKVVFGIYKDRYAKLWDQDIHYTLNIYLWYSII